MEQFLRFLSLVTAAAYAAQLDAMEALDRIDDEYEAECDELAERHDMHFNCYQYW